MRLLKFALLGSLYAFLCLTIFLLEWGKERVGAALKAEPPQPTPEEEA